MEGEFVEADNGTRFKVLAFVGVLLLLIFVERLTSPDPALRTADPVQAFKRSMDRLLIVTLIASPFFLGSSLYLIRLAIKVKRSGQWPPPGMRVPARTRIQRGRRATWNWILIFIVAATLLVPVPALFWAWSVAFRSVSELAIPNNIRADLEYLKVFVAGDPEKDAHSAISKGNLEFLGVAGLSVTVPAGDDRDISDCLQGANYPVRLIRGTSDVIEGDEHMALIERAMKYAARYNAVIAIRRGFSTGGGCRPSNSGVQRSPEDGRR